VEVLYINSKMVLTRLWLLLLHPSSPKSFLHFVVTNITDVCDRWGGLGTKILKESRSRASALLIRFMRARIGSQKATCFLVQRSTSQLVFLGQSFQLLPKDLREGRLCAFSPGSQRVCKPQADRIHCSR
jgi:hypothetical protein